MRAYCLELDTSMNDQIFDYPNKLHVDVQPFYKEQPTEHSIIFIRWS